VISPPTALPAAICTSASANTPWALFEHQSQAYRDSVIPPEITTRVSVEQAPTFGWERYVGPHGQSIGMQTFGASAPLQELQKKFGFTVEHLMAVAKTLLPR
jgi:transketolase